MGGCHQGNRDQNRLGRGSAHAFGNKADIPQPLLTIEMLKLPPPIWALVYVLTAAAIGWFFWLVQGARLSARILGNLVGGDFVDSTCLGLCPLPPRGHRGRTHFTNQSQAHYERSVSIYPEPHVSGPRYSDPWHRNLGRRVANVWCPHSPVRYCQLGPHSL